MRQQPPSLQQRRLWKGYIRSSYLRSLNIHEDCLATEYRNTGSCTSSELVQHIPEQQCSISINGVRMTSQYDEGMRFHVNGYHLKQYMRTESNGWTNAVWNEVDYFAVFGSHFRRLQPSRQAFQMKIVHNQLPTGRDRRFGQAPIQDEALRLCPCCKSTTETMEHHLFTCTCNTGRPSALSTLKSDIVTSDPHPPVRNLLQADLRHDWLSNSPTPFDPSFLEFPRMHFHESIKVALASQARIG